MDLAKLKRLRGAQKSGVTKILSDLDEFLDIASPALLKGRKEAVERAIKKISVYDEHIMELLTSNEDLADEVNSSMDYIATVEASLSRIIDRLDELKIANTTGDVKLPTVQLPIFSGVATEWTAFWDLFKTMIHNKKDLSNVQKLTYLKGQLT